MAIVWTVNFLLVTLGEDWDQQGARGTPSQSGNQSHLSVCKSFWGPKNILSPSIWQYCEHQKESTTTGNIRGRGPVAQQQMQAADKFYITLHYRI